MKKNIFIALAATLVSVGAYAQDTPKKQKKMSMKEKFEKYDTDKDGRLSKAEVDKSGKQKFIAKFAAVDANKDGFLSKEELKAYKKKNHPKGGKK